MDLALESVVKSGPHFNLLLTRRRCLSACWAVWAWERGDEGTVNLSLIPSSVHIPLFLRSASTPSWEHLVLARLFLCGGC